MTDETKVDAPPEQRHWITDDGHFVVYSATRDVYIAGTFTPSGAFVEEKRHDKVDPSWECVQDVFAELEQLSADREGAFRKGYAAGKSYAEGSRTRPVDDHALLWIDDYNLLVVRNEGEGRPYSHLEQKLNGEWQWAGNLDELPRTAIPLYDPSKVSPTDSWGLPDVGVYRDERGHYIVGLEPGGEPGDEVDLSHRHDIVGQPENLALGIRWAKWNLASLLEVDNLETQLADQKAQEVADWIIQCTEVDVDKRGAKEIATLLLDRFTVESKNA